MVHQLGDIVMIDYKEKYEGAKLPDLALAFKDLRDKHSSIKEQAAEVWSEVDYLRMTAIPEMMEEMGIDTVKLTDIGRISTTVQASCSTVNKDALINWLVEHEFGEIVSETVNSSTLKSFVMNQIRDGKEIPDDTIIKFSPYTVATITKG